MSKFMKFERTQWPVGHGGFHTGILKFDKVDFRYFYDCRSKSKEGNTLIEDKLSNVHFNFGVISHFDRDHYEALLNATVDVLFIPYMSPTDMLFYTIASLMDGSSVEEAIQGYAVLRRLSNAGTRIVMVNDSQPNQDSPTADTVEDPISDDAVSLRIDTNRNGTSDYQQMSHESAVDAQLGAQPVLYFKFFN